MTRIIRLLTLPAIIVLALASCSFPDTTGAEVAQATPSLPAVVTIELTVQADTSVPFNTVGQVINYNYNIKNTGVTSTPGPITVTGATVTCPEINTVGNLDVMFDANEILVCAGTYAITQADLDSGSVTTVATANVNGILSNQVTTTVATVQPKALTLTKTASPLTYDSLSQSITYTYTIKNSGSMVLGPAQFTVSDTGLVALINCGDANVTLAPNATVSCFATYVITQADLNAASVTTSATASGGGAGPSQPVSATITKSNNGQTNPATPSNLATGSTVQHLVVDGEWLWQIARCYGADPRRVIEANPQLADPARIKPGITVTVPNVGSNGTIYGPPCVATYTVQAGDTWNSIAQKYNADIVVLQKVNPVTLSPGIILLVPRNSAGGAQIPLTPTTGACLDLTRTFKVYGIAHFYICGQTDAGQTKISTIKISQRLEEAPQGVLLQDINVSIETATPLSDPNSLIVEDMNYDGYDDFRIMEFLPAGPNVRYLYYLYVPDTRQFVYSEAYASITSPEFIGNSQIRSQWRKGADKRGIDIYTVANNIPTLTQRETWETLNETQVTHRITVYNPDGTNLIILDEVIPTP